MRVGILTVQVPFVRGGAELLAENLCSALIEHGHEAEIISIPFKGYPIESIPQQALACGLLDLDVTCAAKIDRVIGLKFPAYFAHHSNKVMWILHQHRSAYDLLEQSLGEFYGSPNGYRVKKLIREADKRIIPEAREIFTISAKVTDRLQQYCGIASTPLYHPPPQAELFSWIEDGDFFLMPSRITPVKRHDLMLDALSLTKEKVRVCFMGMADDQAYLSKLKKKTDLLPQGKAIWLGSVSEAEKYRLYGSCFAVVFPTLGEDYGYVTLESMLSSKATITCTDSGGPLEFITDGETGVVCSPEPQALASVLDDLWRDRGRARRYGRAARARYEAMALGWEKVIDCLTA